MSLNFGSSIFKNGIIEAETTLFLPVCEHVDEITTITDDYNILFSSGEKAKGTV